MCPEAGPELRESGLPRANPRTRESSPGARWVVYDQIEVAGVATDVGLDERTQRDHPEPAVANVVQRARDKRRAEPAALPLGVDLGVQEHDHVPPAIAVDQLPRVLAGQQQLVAALIGTTEDGEVILGQFAEVTVGRL
jgi:hypothetical protein